MDNKISKFQKFQIETIHRSQIKNAPYNPRDIKKENFDRLKRNIKNRGLIETLVWNRTTGNLVSGHQRIKILDTLEKKQDYNITVAVVELDEKTEKEQNIFLNNGTAQGHYVADMLRDLVPEIDYKEAGITEVDLNIIGVQIDLMNQNEVDDVDNFIQEFEDEKKASIEKHKAEIKEKKDISPDDPNKDNTKDATKYIKDWQKSERTEEGADTYFTVTFSTQEAKHRFMERIGEFKESLYLKGELLEKRLFDISTP